MHPRRLPFLRIALALSAAGIVTGQTPAARPADENYAALRTATPAESFPAENIELVRDAAKITLRRGMVTFLSPVMGRSVLAVFRGEGQFDLTPTFALDQDQLARVTGDRSASVQFQSALLAFTDDTFDEIAAQAKAVSLDGEAGAVLRRFRERIRKYATENIEAELLGDLYHPGRPSRFAAYLSGGGYDDLRFWIKPEGVSPSMAPEEVSVRLLDRDHERRGTWYLSHLQEEWKAGRATSAENHSPIDVQHYTIDASIGGNERLAATVGLRFIARTSGDRTLPFDLASTLRVSKVAFGGQETAFIQERYEDDPFLHVILPEPLEQGNNYTLTLEYEGDKVIRDAGGGNFAVGARTSWYPSSGAFKDEATFEMTFRYPRKYTLVAVGEKIGEERENNVLAARWKSDVPLKVAGFNYGEFRNKEEIDDRLNFEMQAFTNQRMPDSLRAIEMALERSPLQAGGGGGTMWSPSGQAERALAEAGAAVRVFNFFFGPTPYSRLAITQQPAMNFGQSWPTLVYLPVISFLDGTQRQRIFQGNAFDLTDFIQEVTPHEVAHQWWGHAVGWATYHDQWISEGFADFSASLFLQASRQKPDDFLKFWRNQRDTILEKNSYGFSANDAGPIWMGTRLSTARNSGAYSRLVYPKGSYVLHMLRYMMFDAKAGDERFIAMMKDFVKTHEHQNASTESFQATVEKHMPPDLNLEKDGTMNWFFRQWVYGTEIPSYRLEYSFVPGENGQFIFKGAVTQTGVSDGFRMAVPVYLELDNGIVRLGKATVVGSQPSEFEIPLPLRPKRALLNANEDILAAKVESVEVKP